MVQGSSAGSEKVFAVRYTEMVNEGNCTSSRSVEIECATKEDQNRTAADLAGQENVLSVTKYRSTRYK